MIGLRDVITCLVALVTIVTGCSEPEGGFVEPTPADKVFYSHHVLVGTVSEILELDPIFGNLYGNSTYGARVRVRCTYKGGVLGDTITIGGAGFVPGLCFAKDLVAGEEVILFLSEKRQGKDVYEQTEPAEPSTKLMEYMGICDLNMQYPKENGITLKREICPPSTELETCKQHTTESTKNKKTMPSPTKPVIHTVHTDTSVNGQPGSGQASRDKDTGNGGQTTVATVTSLLLMSSIAMLV